MTLKVIAYARNGHTDKFGIPRQSRDESPIMTRIVFEPEFAVQEALRGIEGYSHLWLIWGFSEISKEGQRDRKECTMKDVQSTKEGLSWSPTVRPPKLGGNKRMGVFATRSPFRPNPIGLSSVRLIKVAYPRPLPKGKGGQLELLVSGADLLDGTPIYDIKPYLSFSDCHEDAKNGFAEETRNRTFAVVWDEHVLFNGENYSERVLPPCCLRYDSDTPPCPSEQEMKEICYILSQDPRPGYQDDPEREYKMDYAGWTVTFCVENQKVCIKNIERCGTLKTSSKEL